MRPRVMRRFGGVTVRPFVLLTLACLTSGALAGDAQDGDGSDIPNHGRLRVGEWRFQFGPLTGDSLNTIMLDDTPNSKPPEEVTLDVPATHYKELAVLYTGVAVNDARPGKITVAYADGRLEVLEPWEICDWVDPQPDRCKVVLQGCDWWRSDRGLVTGDARVSLYGQTFDVDPSLPIERVQFSVEGMGTAGDVGIFALSGCTPTEPAEMQPIDIQQGFNSDTILHHADDDLSDGFRTEHKPQYFATEAASAATRSPPPRSPGTGVASLADPAEIRRTSPDLIVYDPTGGKRRPWDEVRLWNEHFLVQETGDGNLLAFWTSTTKSVGHSRSEDGGKTWTPPTWFEETVGWQVPVIAPSGRVYVFSTHGGFSGGLSCRVSDDHGRTWAPPVELPFPKSNLDAGTPQWISCTVPHWDRQGRPLIAYTHWASTDAVPGGTAGITSRYSHIESFRIENLHDNPAPPALQFTWLNRDAPVTVPHETIQGASFAQEPYLVDLPDGRMMMAVRTNRGEAWYTVSDDQGESWREAEPMRYRDDGPIIQQPVAPAALFRLGRGDYLYLFNNNDGYVFGATSRWDVRNRRPAFVSRGEFRPQARQPIWWSQPRQIIDNGGNKWRLRLEAAAYTSLTEHKGHRVLWYPDRKGFLLGKYIPDNWLDSFRVPVVQGN
jgi:hypothetical protein